MTTHNFCYLQNRLIQTSQTGGQQYSDTSPFSIPWSSPAWRMDPKGTPHRKVPALLANIRLDWKCLVGTNSRLFYPFPRRQRKNVFGLDNRLFEPTSWRMRMEIPEVKKCPEQSSVGGNGYSKLRLPFSAEHLWISTLRSPARWLYPLKPGGNGNLQTFGGKQLCWFTQTQWKPTHLTSVFTL
jgi:hypothetical protein